MKHGAKIRITIPFAIDNKQTNFKYLQKDLTKHV